jgi:SpoVK/Ycf46/Vps4 family AAA+-type ATPase
MDTITTIDILIASILRDWIATRTWNEELYTLVCTFLSEVHPDCTQRVWQKFKEEKKTDAEGSASLQTEGEACAGSISVAGTQDGLRITCLTLLKDIPEYPGFLPGMEVLAKTFDLSRPELNTIAFFYAYLSFGPLEIYVDKLADWDTLRRLAAWADVEVLAMVSMLKANGTLMKKGLAERNGRALRLTKYGISFVLVDTILNYLLDGGEGSLASYLLEIDTKPVLPMDSFDLSDTVKAAASAVMQAPSQSARLLLYGKPGTGKTEFARALCSSLGLKACFIRQKQDDSTAVFVRMNLASRCVDVDREVLVIDEADDFLNVEPGFFQPKDGVRKGLVNEFLDATPARMIFITNQTWRISDSILRRMSYHLDFQDFSFQQRLRLWNKMCPENGTFAEDEVKHLASRYKANPSRIRQVVDVCLSSRITDSGHESLEIAKELLARSDKLMYRKPIKQDEVLSWYDPMALNLSLPVEELVSRLGRWRAAFDGQKVGVNLLFHGAPGTGKTAFATWLGEKIDMLPVVKKASDLLDMFVGGTEEKIRDAFREAEGSMLIIDEADSFLANRAGARHSWERTMTNEVLTQMESFKGMFVAATNFNTILDPASLRRFAFKLEFKPPEPGKILSLLDRRFPGLDWMTLPAKDVARLAGLTPGDIAAVARRLEYAGPVDTHEIMDALREELGCQTPIAGEIGFCK